MLSEQEKQILLQAARQSIESVVLDKPLPNIPSCPPQLMQPSGAFVTIHEQGELRGCIGYTDAIKPLIETVTEVAAKAACEDPRFVQVSPDELSIINIEISVISPMKNIQDLNEIEIGKHGLMLELEHYRGLLLPQVATAYSWDRETFLNQTARKAGLPADAWKHPEVKISIFTAEIFGEHSPELMNK